MAELRTVETEASTCCSAEAQRTCCEPGDKADCCGEGNGDGCGCSAGEAAEADELREAADVREAVRERYAALAGAGAASLGCGNPTAVAELHGGETALDLGSGGGDDVLLAARRVGPDGKAFGLDMTDQMLALARRRQRAAGAENVEFLKGTIEDVPLADDSVDVVISNVRARMPGRG